jgi:hypothetical protein
MPLGQRGSVNLVSTDTTRTDVIPVKVVQRSRWSEDKLEFGGEAPFSRTDNDVQQAPSTPDLSLPPHH